MWKFLAGLLLITPPAFAHEWYNQYKQFPNMASSSSCCGGDDCIEVSLGQLSFAEPGKITVTLKPGQHQLHPEGGVFTTERQQQFAPDGKTHVCIGPTGTVLCVFAGAGS